MKTERTHEAVNKKGCTCHVARVFNNTDEEVQENDKGNETQDRPDTADSTVYDKRAKLFVDNDGIKPVAQHTEPFFQPILRISADIDNHCKHEPHKKEEDRKP